jgi:hypothetical protein
MDTEVTSNYAIDSWHEETYHEAESGAKLTHAHAEQMFSGDIEGHGDVHWMMCYRADGTADFVGLLRLAGRVGERSGAIVLETRGTFDGRAATGPLRIVSGSGTDGLSGISGDGELRAPRGEQASITLSYRFE